MNSYNNKKTLLILLLSFFIISWPNIAQAYTPPIGIPDPGAAVYGWGATHPIDSTAPNQPGAWPESEVAGYYYIDNTDANATDSSNTYGYPNKPRATIPEITYAAGSYVEVHGGPYTDTYIVLQFSGTADSPVWFRGTPGAMPIISGNVFISDSSFAILENLDFDGGSGSCIRMAALNINHIAIRNSKFRNRVYPNQNTAAIGITPNLGGTIKDIIVYQSEFYGLGDWQTTVDQDFHGINPNLWGRDATTTQFNIWILNNNFYNLSGNGVQVNAGNWDYSHQYLHHVYIGKNVSHDSRQSAFGIKQSTDVIISQNTTYSNKDHGVQEGTGIVYQYAPDNLWIIFNKISDSDHGIRQSANNTPVAGDENHDVNHKAYIIGNKIFNIHPDPLSSYTTPTHGFRPGQGISLWKAIMQRYIIDNTIYDSHGGINIKEYGPVTLSGNIISDIYYLDYHISNLDATAVTTLDYNLFFDGPIDPDNQQTTSRFRWAGQNYTTLTDFQTATGQCNNCWVVDPQFIDPANNNFNLKPTSPAKGKGVRNAVYDTFLARYGISIAYDIDGIPRPASGTGWDLGAFQSRIPSLTSIGGAAD